MTEPALSVSLHQFDTRPPGIRLTVILGDSPSVGVLDNE
jgi:hypothetical protein